MRLLLFLFVLALSLAVAPSAASAQEAVEGPWTMSIDSPEGANEFPVIITEDAGVLSVTTPPSPEGTFTFVGTVDGESVTFDMVVDYQGTELPIGLTGTLEGDRMEGVADFGGMAQGSWDAVRTED